MSKRHKLFEVIIKWNDTNEEEDAVVSIGEGIDQSTDCESIFTFTEYEWNNVKNNIKNKGKSNCGDFCITNIIL